ncbi:hypothetical protein Q4493_07295 [Colwellia sp. 1_MG-2023]|uniref:hypothetical protein n=1 Tax=Colwellia sp. 1_MG-2023 TaxID=3062649 RepID=UPI0026E1D816|nr:hypothetical protein [Colwellia sp. 1_MG-2023]MDO6445577.1 hypothetical protein [Colwellia sp. 1_MG-2023]
MTSVTTITSNEKGVGNIFCYISYAITVIIFISIFKALLKGEVNVAFLYTSFLLFCLVIYLIGRFINKNFDRLGETPLTVRSTEIHKGLMHQASILIKQNNFSRVRNVLLKCLYTRYSYSGGTVLPNVIYEVHIPIRPEFDGNSTALNFEFEIPENMLSSDDKSSKVRVEWQLSFKFLDGIEEVSRTWTIKVK